MSLAARVLAAWVSREVSAAIDGLPVDEDPHVVAIRRIAREVGPVRQVDDPRRASRRDRNRGLAELASPAAEHDSRTAVAS